MKTLLLIILLTTSQFSFAYSNNEIECLAKSTYLEGRSLNKTLWIEIAKVAVKRSKNPHKYSSKSANLCDIVATKEYTSSKLLHKPIKEKKIYAKILSTLQTTSLQNGKFTYFSSHRNKLKFK